MTMVITFIGTIHGYGIIIGTIAMYCKAEVVTYTIPMLYHDALLLLIIIIARTMISRQCSSYICFTVHAQ